MWCSYAVNSDCLRRCYYLFGTLLTGAVQTAGFAVHRWNDSVVIVAVMVSGSQLALSGAMFAFHLRAEVVTHAAEVFFDLHFPSPYAFGFDKPTVQRVTCIVLRIPTSGQQKARRKPGFSNCYPDNLLGCGLSQQRSAEEVLQKVLITSAVENDRNLVAFYFRNGHPRTA
jgi:hypothetical protein